jgi:hypothetical protein
VKPFVSAYYPNSKSTKFLNQKSSTQVNCTTSMMIGFFFSSLVKPESSAILVCSYGCSLLLNELLMLCLNLIYLAVANPPTHSNLRLQIISRPETTSYNIFFCSHSDCSCVSHFNFYNSFTDTELASSQSCSVIGSTISWIALWLLLTLT